MNARYPDLEGEPEIGEQAWLDLLRVRDGAAVSSALLTGDPRGDLYLPLLGPPPPGRPFVSAHLAQSLDGVIASHGGQSQWITGEADLDHTHRMRALADAVVVGANTIAADDPRLTVRRVPGPQPLRVVLDPGRRLDAHHQVFADGRADTMLVCDRALAARPCGRARVLGLPTQDGVFRVEAILDLLWATGCRRVFVEGGGYTVSAFLEAGLLDRLHLVVAPVLMGGGRPGIRFSQARGPHDGLRPPARAHALGCDTLFDCAF